MRWRLALILLLTAVAACGGPSPPTRQRVDPPRDLNGPQRANIRQQLQVLASHPSHCFALLDRAAGLKVGREPDVREAPLCAKVNTVTLKQTPAAFAQRTQLTCPMAAGIYLWQRDALLPLARKHFGQTVVRVETFGTYACRSRNSQPGAQISEHARANAIDISAFVLADGRRIKVKDGWSGPDGPTRQFLRDIFQGGCRYFAVALGPDSDRFHQDHLHFDLGAWPKCG